jgi:formylglycine-generating enzyme required for sulfatase activity
VLARFRREAEVASRLDHPGLCAVFDVGSHDRWPYLVMRHVPGETLAVKIRRAREAKARSMVAGKNAAGGPDRPSPPAPARMAEHTAEAASVSGHDQVPAIVRMIEEAARAVHVAHQAGIVHRDLKPGNIMVTPSGEPVILDFGLAREVVGEGTALTRTGEVFGTPAYLAPELVTGRVKDVDLRADVYSLGVTLYEALTLRRPFEAPTRQALYRAIASQEVTDPRRLHPDIPRELSVVVEKALEKEPARRYATALAFAEDLRRVRLREPIVARPAGAALRLWRWGQRHPAVAALLSMILVSLSAALLVALVQLRELQARERQTRRNFDDASRNLTRLREVSDQLGLERLIRTAEEKLWPAWPAMIDGLERWLREAAELKRQRATHEHELRALEAAAPPPTEEEVSRDADERRRRFPVDHLRFDSLLYEQAWIEAELRRPSLSRTRRREYLKELEEVRRSLALERAKPAHTARLSWRFEDPEEDQRHAALIRLLEGIDNLPVLISKVETRLDRARALKSWPPEDDRPAWKRCAAEIKADARFGGLDLLPQLDLRPLGRNPTTGFWEFWHCGSGLEPAMDLETGRVQVQGEMAIVFVLLPGGPFLMGAQPDEPQAPHFDVSARDNEKPVHTILLVPFFLARHEMTQAQWQRVMDSNPSGHQLETAGPNEVPVTLAHPVESISWEEASAALRRLGLTLPTEAQWEYGCRGGTETVWFTDDGPQGLVGHAHLDLVESTGIPKRTVHAPVGQFEPNAFGLHDMHGNVREWCLDHAGDYSEPVEPGTGLRQTLAPRKRIYRGGSYVDKPGEARSAYRVPNDGELRDVTIGFRASRPVERLPPAK